MWLPSDEEIEFAESIHDVLQARRAVALTRRDADDPFSWNSSLWGELTQMGVADLLRDREAGAMFALAEKFGGAPATVPVLTSAILVPAIAQSIGIDLDTHISWGFGGFAANGTIEFSDISRNADGTYSGIVPRVLGATWAESILLVLTDGLLVISKNDVSRVEPRDSLDVTLPFAEIHLREVESVEYFACDPEAVAKAVNYCSDLASLWVTASLVGTASQLLDWSVDYSAQRIQFGMPIGARQAIKHKCAQMLIEIESARSAVWNAIDSVGAGPALSSELHVARIAGAKAADYVAQEAFQIHGGIGFTWEHDLHFLFKRVQVGRQLFGGAEDAYSRLHTTLVEERP